SPFFTGTLAGVKPCSLAVIAITRAPGGTADAGAAAADCVALPSFLHAPTTASAAANAQITVARFIGASGCRTPPAASSCRQGRLQTQRMTPRAGSPVARSMAATYADTCAA